MKKLEGDIDKTIAVPKRLLNFRKERPTAPLCNNHLLRTIATVLHQEIKKRAKYLRITNSEIYRVIADDNRYNDLIWYMQMLEFKAK